MFRTNNDIDMKLRPVTKFNKRNTATSKKSNDKIISASCDVIAFQFMTNLEPSGGRKLHFINKNPFV